MLISLITGSVLQIAAQNDVGSTGTNTNSLWPDTTSKNSFWVIYNKDESNLITNNNPDCKDKVDSVLKGVAPELIIDFGLKVTLDTESFEVTCVGKNFQNGDIESAARIINKRNSAGLVNGIMALNGKLLDQRPASGADYIEQKVYALQNLGKVSAQEQDLGLYYPGLGYNLLQPVQSFWGWSVTIVYSLMIFIIIVVALGIMFRNSLSGGIAVALQSSIPNIALAMILVPLSYAITGLFIDGITLGVNATHMFLIGPGSPGHGVYEEQITKNDLVIDIGGEYVNRGLHADDAKVSWLYSGIILSRPIADGTQSFGESLTSATDSMGLIGAMGAFIGSLIGQDWLISVVSFILGVLLMLTGLRIFWKLLKKYVYFITMPLISPFIFATIALPGSGVKTIMWYTKNMGSATLAYVVTYAMILLSIVLSSSYFLSQLPNAEVTTFVPPLTAIESVLLNFSNDVNAGGGANSFIDFMFILVAFAIYMLIPKTLDQIDEALGVGSMPAFLGDILQSTKDSVGIGRAGLALPGQAVRGAGRVASAPGRGLTALQRRLGIDEKDYGSIQNRIGRTTSRVTAGMRKNAENINNPLLRGAARAAAGAASGAVNTVGNTIAGGTDLTARGEEQIGGGKIKASFKWNAGDNEIVFDDALVSQIMESSLAADVAGPGRQYEIRGPKVALSIEGSKFPQLLTSNNTSIVLAVADGGDSGRAWDLSADETYSRLRRRDTRTGGLPSRTENNRLITLSRAETVFHLLGMEDAYFFTFELPEYNTSNSRTEAELSMLFVIPEYVNVGGVATDGRIHLLNHLAKNFVKSKEKIAFNINGAESNACAFRITPAFVNSGNRIDINAANRIGVN